MTDEQRLRAAFGRVRGRWFAAASLGAVARAAGGCGCVVLAAVVAERILAPAGLALALLAGATLAACAGCVGWAVWPMRKRPADRQVARFVEERCPELEDRLAAAAEFPGADASAFRDLILADAATQIETVDLDRVVSGASIRSAAVAATAATAALLMVLSLGVGPVRRGWNALSSYAFPESFAIEVLPGDVKVMTGQPVRISATIRRSRNGSSEVVPVLTLGAGENRRSVPMRWTGTRFETEVRSVTSSFQYRVAVARTVSHEYTVTALRTARVERIDLEYDYPPYTGLPRRVETDGGDIYAPPGTRVLLHVHTDKPVQSGTLEMEDGTEVPLRAAGEKILEGGLKIDDDGSYRVAIADREGLRNPGETEYFIRMMDDRPPDVRILRPAGDRQVTPLEEVPIEVRAEDDYGIDGLELVYAVRGGAEKVVPLGGRGRASVSGSHLLYVEDLGVKPGDFVSYFARARDVSRGKRSTASSSDIFFLEVKPFEEEFAAAQSQAMMGSGGGGLESLVAAQKEIIIATWKLDRRSSGGKSQQDIKTLARAQGELQTRALQAAAQAGGGMRDTRRSRPGATQAEAAETDRPMVKAAEAMTRARTELDAAKIKEALPHEMEALNQLLRAQAEIRRRQVGRQQASGGGDGGGRNQQDLTTLFDRELQRQQQTNYENRTSEPQQQQPQSDALSAVRDLARRQDELSQQERELARQRARLSDEEVRRQLEKLTREQSELRREAEELARRLQQRGQQGQQQTQGQKGQRGQQGQGRSGSQTAQGSEASDSLRDISEEMRSAASELRREDPQSASARSGRAVDKLRELERQLQTAGPGGQRRALGELQMEAQQLAEAEQRVASEARQLGKTEPGADARRRLSGDQERLAERVEKLGRTAGQLAAQPGTERQALGDVARDIDRQQLGQRMRESAAALRTGKRNETAASGQPRPADQADAEQALARALDRVAERLGSAQGGRDAQSQKLSDQLARARDLRDRLADVERRIERMARGTPAQGQQGQSGDRPQSNGQNDQRGQPGQQGRDSQSGQRGASGSGSGGSLAELRQEYDRQLREAQDLVRDLQRGSPGAGGTPERHEYTASAPGTEAFKQDFAKWEVLRKDVNLALEKLEASLTGQLAERVLKDRLKAGGDDRLPDEYRTLVAEYYQSLAKRRR